MWLGYELRILRKNGNVALQRERSSETVCCCNAQSSRRNQRRNGGCRFNFYLPTLSWQVRG